MSQNIIFPMQEVTGNVTSVVDLKDGEVLHVKMVDFQEGDSLIVEEEVILSDCDLFYKPVKYLGNPCCCCEDGSVRSLEYSYPTTDFLMPISGRYRFILTNAQGLEESDPNYFSEAMVVVSTHKPNSLMDKFINFNC